MDNRVTPDHLRLNKKLGQVFLKDRNNLARIVEAGHLTLSDHVVEIGCGEGWLSLQLAEKAGQLTIYEVDDRFLAMTRDRLASFSTVKYVLGDVLEQALVPEAAGFKLVANIPYQISAPIVKQLIQNRQRLQLAVLLVQQEFAQKVVAKPGADLYTSFTVYCQYFFDTRFLFKVSRNCFRPIPKVDSAVIELIPKLVLALPEAEEAAFFSVVRSLFWARRKTVLNCLKHSPYLELKPGFEAVIVPWQSLRGETLGLMDFLALYQVLKGFIG